VTGSGKEVGGDTVLAIRDTRFTLDGNPTFLLGISYYGALGAPEDFIRHDLDDLQRLGFNWLRRWATWESFGHDISAVDAEGRPREQFLGRLRGSISEYDRRGLVVDGTLARGKVPPGATSGGRLPDFPAHRRAFETLIGALKDHRNCYLDLANERHVRDDRHVPAAELKIFRDLVRQLDPTRLVTASFGGHDLGEEDLREARLVIGLEFLAPHRPRDAESPGQTEDRTRACLSLITALGRAGPVHYQEPFRRGYRSWRPIAPDFLTDLRGALAGGAAGWCLHNGAQHGTPGNRPRRSFDLRDQRLFEQLDKVERKAVDQAANEVRRRAGSQDLHTPLSPPDMLRAKIAEAVSDSWNRTTRARGPSAGRGSPRRALTRTMDEISCVHHHPRT
jgi:hypothetical protein